MGHSLTVNTDGPRKIDCGLKKIDSFKYKRNYFINRNTEEEKKTQAGEDLNMINFSWNEAEVSCEHGDSFE